MSRVFASMDQTDVDDYGEDLSTTDFGYSLSKNSFTSIHRVSFIQNGFTTTYRYFMDVLEDHVTPFVIDEDTYSKMLHVIFTCRSLNLLFHKDTIIKNQEIVIISLKEQINLLKTISSRPGDQTIEIQKCVTKSDQPTSFKRLFSKMAELQRSRPTTYNLDHSNALEMHQNNIANPKYQFELCLGVAAAIPVVYLMPLRKPEIRTQQLNTVLYVSDKPCSSPAKKNNLPPKYITNHFLFQL
ncbi:hypothetical protein FQA39_LY02192 [Lamprigera yunnana]|nr:hypothetical protein FQA39_LY02192 [Lamprigera yunnana]